MALPAVTRLSKLTPARERVIAVEPALTRLFPDAGLRRGHVLGCGGVAARSLALALAARAVADGAWLAVVGVPELGVEAATHLGLPAHRVVAIAARTAQEWGERITAAADGFELILTVPPPGAERQLRKLRQRLQARGSVLLVIPPVRITDPPRLGCDVDLTTSDGEWFGIGDGHGRLTARRVTIESSGRRVPRPVTIECWLPGPDGGVDVVQTGRAHTDIAGTAIDTVAGDTIERAS